MVLQIVISCEVTSTLSVAEEEAHCGGFGDGEAQGRCYNKG